MILGRLGDKSTDIEVWLITKAVDIALPWIRYAANREEDCREISDVADEDTGVVDVSKR